MLLTGQNFLMSLCRNFKLIKNESESKNWHDYILFSDNDITIEDIKYDPY